MNVFVIRRLKHLILRAIFVFLLFTTVASATTFYYSVDIGSDLEYSDPYAWMVPPQSNNEYLDPAKIYTSDPTGGNQAQEVKTDLLIFVQAPLPEPGSPVPVAPNDNHTPQLYFDIDGEDQLGTIPADYVPGEGITGPVQVSPDPGVGLFYNPAQIYYSLDDDGPPAWWSPAPSDVPVIVAPDRGTFTGQDEILGTTGSWRLWSVGNSFVDEKGLTLGPNPPGRNNDDDVDALDTRLYRYWYWTCDHEAHMGLDPGVIYVTDTGAAGANANVYITPALLGINPGTDIDAFEFCVTDDPDLVQQHFGLPAGTYLAVVFSVDQDDPTTQTVESGGLFPGAIYISLLTGLSGIGPVALITIDDDVDALAFEEQGEEPPDRTKWIQLPDLTETGVDVCGTVPNLLADDFQCTTNQAITNIVIYASWRDDLLPANGAASVDFVLSFHADIPANQSQNGYSVPADPPLWTFNFPPGSYTAETNTADILEWWYNPDPDNSQNYFPGDKVCWKYTFPVSLADAFVQTGRVDNPVVYWLDAQVITPIAPDYYWGWKSSLDHWNDDAVWALGDDLMHGPWQELTYAAPHPFFDPEVPVSMDLAFELYGGDLQEEDQIDFGDAPEGTAAPMYPTKLANNGARHVIGGPWLGDSTDGPDSEPDGQPDPNALGDDNDGNDDEDGATFPAFIIGQPASVQFEVNGSAGVQVAVELWIDWNGNFIWEVSEYYSTTVSDGIHTLAIPTVPAAAVTGSTFARMRIASTATGSPVGLAPDGEVEDYEVLIEAEPPDLPKWIQEPDLTIFGVDVCGSYPNLLADDFECRTQEAITNIVIWSSWRDDRVPDGDPASVEFVLSFHGDIPAPPTGGGYSEPSEPPLWLHYFPAGSYTAEKYRENILEWWYNPDIYNYTNYFPGDTVCWKYTFPVPLQEAFVQTGTVNNAVTYWLDAQMVSDLPPDMQWGWKSSLDHWNDDAVWTIGDEQNHLPWQELRYDPPHELTGQSMDLAFALYGGAPPEEYQVDWGDAPDRPYPTFSINGGAGHIIGGPWLGGANDAPDGEPDGQPTLNADGDNLAGFNDENGVSIPSMTVGIASTIAYTVSGISSGGSAVFEMWIDWNRNGSWGDSGEVYGPFAVPGNATYGFNTMPPLGISAGQYYARCRISTAGTGGPTGLAPDGEVEDYKFGVEERFDYGDAPDPTYPTYKASGGAAHVLTGPYLGASRDPDTDGQPSPLADGDDLNGSDDEDGIILPAYMRRDRTETVKVIPSAACKLNAWIDYNLDGLWGGSEQIFTDVPLVAGTTNLTFHVPFGAALGTNYARFRISTAGGDSPGGLAYDGEVEDYMVVIREKFPPALGLKWRQPPDCYSGLDLQSWMAVDLQGQIYESPVVADDWWCDGRPINSIRWWGSYILYGDPSGVPPTLRPNGFRLRWYLDIPAVAGGPQSRPGPMLKECYVALDSYGSPMPGTDIVSENYACTVPLDYLGPLFAGIQEHKYEYNVVLSDPWMEKNTLDRGYYEPPCSSNVYWISIEAVYDTPPDIANDFLWGWETTSLRYNWNDAAVTAINTLGGTNTPWTAMSYIPQLWPWTRAVDHPYTNQPVNMAFAMLSDVVGRRDVKWSQLPNMTKGTDMPSWRYDDPLIPAPPWSQTALRADDFISDGRRITDIHWWGSYIGWQQNYNADEFDPIVAPLGIEERPLGFDLSWHLHDPAMGGPGMLLTNVFIPMKRCHEMYYCTILQEGAPYEFEHEYQYYVDLLDEQLDTLPWLEEQGVHYWLNIQAVFATNFIPAVEWEAGRQYPHEGWGWKIAGIDPDLRLEPSVVSTNFVPVTIWDISKLPYWHRDAGLEHDLAFELTTDQPRSNAVINIVSIARATNAVVAVGSVGTGGAGVQVLQKTGALKPSPMVWVDVKTNEVPFPAPFVNTWLRYNSPVSNEFYRVIEFTP